MPIVAINSDLGEPVNEARIRKVLPKFRAVTLAGDGHFLMMEDPQRFNPGAGSGNLATLVGRQRVMDARVPWGTATAASERGRRVARASAGDHAALRPGVRRSRHEMALRPRCPVRTRAGSRRHRRRAGGGVCDAASHDNLNAPPAVQLHMLSNIALDALIGMVPILGRPVRFRVQGADAQSGAAGRLRRHTTQGRAPQPPRAAAHRARHRSSCSPRSARSASGCSTSCFTGLGSLFTGL